MYKSPIEIKLDDIISNVVEKTDEYMMRCVQQVGVDVDKDQLFKALEYDRDQYEKGYADGRADAARHGHWESEYGLHYCSECKNYAELNPTLYCPNCGAKMDEIVDGYKYDFKTHKYVYVQSSEVDKYREGRYAWEEPEINPCCGCDDYDGRGGCKSNGGCGADLLQR